MALDDLVVDADGQVARATAPGTPPPSVQTLRELLEKAARQAADPDGLARAGHRRLMPTRAGSRRRWRPPARPPGRKRRRKGSGASLETLGLVAALFVVAGLIGYLVWPPGRTTCTRMPRP